MMRLLNIFVYFYAALSTFSIGSHLNADQISLKIQNSCGYPIEVYYVSDINQFDDANIVAQTKGPLRNGTSTRILSYNGHYFIVKMAKSRLNLSVDNKEGNIFQKLSRPETVVVKSYDMITGLFNIEQKTLVNSIKDSLTAAVINCKNNTEITRENMQDCMEKGILNMSTNLMESRNSLRNYNKMMSDKLYNYTCADSVAASVTKQINVPIRSKINNKAYSYRADKILSRESSKIWSIDNFISQDECSALISFAKDKLLDAKTYEDDTVHRSRHAKQATFVFSDKVKLDVANKISKKNSTEYMLFDLYNRVLGVASTQTGRDLSADGQEDFSIIRYFPGEYYSPHCDGSCDGEKYKSGGRVATALLYCQEPTKGGMTIFPFSDIYLDPKKGRGLFFSYVSDDDVLDDGFTQHAGCPVLEGEKWVISAWMRDGISSSNPWQNYDSHGNPISSDEHEHTLKDTSKLKRSISTETDANGLLL